MRVLGKCAQRIVEHYYVYKQFGIFLPQLSHIQSYQNIVIGKNFSLSENCRLYCHDPDNGSVLEIGDNVTLNTGVSINSDCGGIIKIGNNVLIGPDVVIRASKHRIDDREKLVREQGHVRGEIYIEDDVWLGAKVVVLQSVVIGKGSVIGAGSIVNSDIPPYSVAVGSPAIAIRYRCSNEDNQP